MTYAGLWKTSTVQKWQLVWHVCLWNYWSILSLRSDYNPGAISNSSQNVGSGWCHHAYSLQIDRLFENYVSWASQFHVMVTLPSRSPDLTVPGFFLRDLKFKFYVNKLKTKVMLQYIGANLWRIFNLDLKNLTELKYKKHILINYIYYILVKLFFVCSFLSTALLKTIASHCHTRYIKWLL